MEQLEPNNPAPLYVPQRLDSTAVELISQLAPVIHAAHMFNVKSPEQAATVMLKGHELGFSLAASFEFIDSIQGRPTLSPRGALALIHRSPLVEVVKLEETPTACSVTMRRKDSDFVYTATFSLEDAVRAGLLKPDSGWSKYPANMLRWRAIGFCADVVCPDVLAGMRMADSLGAVIDINGDFVK